MSEAVATQPTATNCYLVAWDRLQQWKNSTAPPYYLDMDLLTWAQNYDAGLYRKPFSFQVLFAFNAHIRSIP